MSAPNDGGPAFPQVSTDAANDYADGEYQVYGNTYSHGGMSLRDYFAAKAMHAILRGPDPTNTPPKEFAALAAKSAYHMADAMLAAREAQP